MAFAFRWTFHEKVAKSASFRERARKTIDFARTWSFSSKLPCLGIFMNFSAMRCKKCLISWKSTKNHRFAQHYATFPTNYHVFAFRWTFKEKVGKSGSFREKARKLLHFVKTCNFSKKLPCFHVWMNFSAKSCRNCLISWKSTKNHRFGQNYATFSNKLPWVRVRVNANPYPNPNHHIFTFRWTFQRKVAKTASFCEKARKLIDFVKTMQLFLTNYHVLVFRWTFQQKVAKSGLIREKARKIIDLAKTLQLFEQTTMSLHFDQLFRKKLQEVAHFVKKHEKSSIWPKLATFGANYHVLAFSWTFQKEVAKSASFREKAREIIDLANTMQLLEQTTMFLHFDELLRKRLEKVVHFVKKHEKAWILSKLATFRTKYHVFMFRWTFPQTVAKTASFREKARKLMDLAKTMQLFRTNYHVLVFRSNFSAKGCKRWLNSWKSTKHHRFGQNLATFRGNYHVFPFRSTFQEKVVKSASFRRKARKIIDLAKSL